MAAGGFLDPSNTLSANAAAFWVFGIATTLIVAASIVVAVVETYRLRSPLPPVVFVSATLWLPNEPLVDAIIGFHYAADSPIILFTLWDRAIPLGALGIGAMFFLFPWAIYRMATHRVPMTRIVAVCLIAGVIDWFMEWAAIHWKLFEYYGNNPLRILGLPTTSMAQNSFIYALMAAAILLAAPRLQGWRVLLFLPVMPGLYLGGAALCTWPAYLGVHTHWPTLVVVALAAVSTAMNVYIPLSALTIAKRTPPPHDEPAAARSLDTVAG
ncbi:hypothetical protein [Mycobacterium parmense]|uniref:hypothetical protein n=1 Tax=Mycobacterium parmense TaxID=185642 RepID=UPI000A14C68B|nr:hypothetical protein [Mycobacterium parmense]MCV7353637.1 hypothetical protein [Mycobacterium parmense]ORW60096.1 hypothetical protein AWC20_09120 [Mycobacterium parmense]